MSPSQAAGKVGIAPATANRYYEKWSKEIREGLEQRLLPSLEESVKKVRKKKRQ
jgi:hypothetical protein